MWQSTELNRLQSFPLPDKHALRHSQTVHDSLCEYINKQNGVISFDQYTSFVLYKSGLGYYSSGNQKFGAAGDFTTAPEISPLFSQCIANQCRSILEQIDNAVIIEIGAGSGIMACDILKHLEQLGALPAKYMILELSAELRDRQQALIKQQGGHLFDRVKWLDALPDDASFSGIIIGNEVLDAMPVKRFIIDEGKYRQLGVGAAGNQLAWKIMEMDDALKKETEKIPRLLSGQFCDGYISEINLQLQPWLAALFACLYRGAVLLIDYGYPMTEYFHPQRSGGTLLCHYHHRAHDDPFLYPGLQDISASVNFTALAEKSVQCGFELNGYTAQAYFLIGNGLENEMWRHDRHDTKTQTEIARQARILTLPNEMGERFKAMALTKNFDTILQGFAIKDQRILL